MIYERNAQEITFYAVLAVASTPAAFGALPPSLSDQPVFGHAAGAALCAGAVLAFVGCVWRKPSDGEFIAQVGLVLLCFGGIGYTAALLLAATSLTVAALAAGLSAGIGVGSFLRFLQLRKRSALRVEVAKAAQAVDEAS